MGIIQLTRVASMTSPAASHKHQLTSGKVYRGRTYNPRDFRPEKRECSLHYDSPEPEEAPFGTPDAKIVFMKGTFPILETDSADATVIP